MASKKTSNTTIKVVVVVVAILALIVFTPSILGWKALIGIGFVLFFVGACAAGYAVFKSITISNKLVRVGALVGTIGLILSLG